MRISAWIRIVCWGVIFLLLIGILICGLTGIPFCGVSLKCLGGFFLENRFSCNIGEWIGKLPCFDRGDKTVGYQLDKRGNNIDFL